MRLLSFPSRSPRPLQVIALAATLVLLLSIVACGPGSPEEKVTQTRGQYSVKLENWFPKVEEPDPYAETETIDEQGEALDEAGEAEATATSGEVAMDGETEATGEGEEGDEEIAEAAPEGPTPTTIFFDLIVLFSGSEPLDGITVDVTHADASGAEKRTWRKYLETPGIVKSEARQIGFEEEVHFEEGDVFSVQLLKYVDPANYGEYKEYTAAQ